MRICVRHAGLIGDSLAHIPYLAHLAEQEHVVAVGKFNKLVQELIYGLYDISFEEGDGAGLPYLSIDLSFGKHTGFHMCQAFFGMAHKEVPCLPMYINMNEVEIDLPPGVVVSPFSRSDLDGNKFWANENWVKTVEFLRDKGLADRAYVLGSTPTDDVSEYWRSNIEPVVNQPLTKVLNLLRRSPLVLSVDNGISNLCHYGSVDKHVLLYPQCLPPTWVDNPMAVKVRGIPASIPWQTIADAAVGVLDGSRGI